MAKVTKEMVWLTYILKDMFFYVSRPINLFCDNQSAVYITPNLVFHKRMEHIELNCHFVRKKHEKKLISFNHVPSHC